MNLSQAKVLITGGSSGIGKATAQLLLRKGAKVAICGRDPQKLQAAADELGAVALPADVSNEAQVTELVQAAVTQLGGYNVLINNAGFGLFAPLTELDPADFRRVWETNVLGAMLVAQASARHFVQEKYGNIINISSTAGSRGFAGGTAYASSKFALGGMTECWRAELRPHNIRVMQVNPSEVLTEFRERSGRDRAPENPTKLHAEDIAHAIASLLELDDRGFVTETTVWATNPRE
ncbi:3-oxoacyl-[acyl-carrier protein] reductase [Catalinimonas alkaloidigena]|uniref:3-oxoacyl-[acyl-carrier protein] reductase n=1 Tax=Catalinimonas alkaloidigena TaxID=1075417 RepID=A0A1G9DGL5_9BACT|nr:SDR family oxidoreductase [Catalinimonas alkaloidigena]SDK63009.1 3-oxoacyl-[acyl-carrier protein] reductase [Catalinimonas alkaloidigena]